MENKRNSLLAMSYYLSLFKALSLISLDNNLTTEYITLFRKLHAVTPTPKQWKRLENKWHRRITGTHIQPFLLSANSDQGQLREQEVTHSTWLERQRVSKVPGPIFCHLECSLASQSLGLLSLKWNSKQAPCFLLHKSATRSKWALNAKEHYTSLSIHHFES